MRKVKKELTIKIPVNFFLKKRVLDMRTNNYEDGEKVLREIKVKNDYMENFPTDDMGEHINETVSYYDIYMGMAEGKDVYDMLNVGDSLIRERVFRRLSELLETEYETIYYLWLNNDEQ